MRWGLLHGKGHLPGKRRRFSSSCLLPSMSPGACVASRLRVDAPGPVCLSLLVFPLTLMSRCPSFSFRSALYFCVFWVCFSCWAWGPEGSLSPLCEPLLQVGQQAPRGSVASFM